MTVKLVAFAMPFVTLAFMTVLAYGIARYNRRPGQRPAHAGAFVIETVRLSLPFKTRLHFKDRPPHRH